MEIFLIILLLIVGLILIVKGGDFFVDAASWIAEVSGIPQFIIGATIVSVATTLPEMIVSIIAAAEGKVDMAVGNAVGSVTANTGLIMAISLIFAPFAIKRKELWPKATIALVSIALLYALSSGGSLNMWLALLLIIPFGLYIYDNIKEAKKSAVKSNNDQNLDDNLMLDEATPVKLDDGDDEPATVEKDKKTVAINIAKFVFGAAGIVLGARLLVDNGSALATLAGIPEGIIAVTLVAIGTSLPELVTMVTSLIKKKGSMSVGNILGANIIDITLILPICAAISGSQLIVSRAAVLLDMPFCLGIGAIALIPTLFTQKFQRWQGVVMLVAYVTYLTLRMTLGL